MFFNYFYWIVIHLSFCFSQYYNAGGLFHNGDIDQELAFRYAVEKINLDKTILPRSKLSAQIEHVSPEDSFHASKRGLHWIEIKLIVLKSDFINILLLLFSVPFAANGR